MRGRLSMERGGGVDLATTGYLGGQPVELRLMAGADAFSYGSGPELAKGDVPPHLREALLVGLTRMGILHNLACLTGNAAPDHADGGVEAWVTVGSFQRPDGELGGPLTRRQTVRFPMGEMRVVERYRGVVIRP